jgi:hypothetical protein
VVGIGTDNDATVKLSAAEIIRERLSALRQAQQRPPVDTEPEELPWDGEPVEGEVIDHRDAKDAGDGDWS